MIKLITLNENVIYFIILVAFIVLAFLLFHLFVLQLQFKYNFIVHMSTNSRKFCSSVLEQGLFLLVN